MGRWFDSSRNNKLITKIICLSPSFLNHSTQTKNGAKYWHDNALNAYCKSVGVAAYVWIIETQTGRRSRILVNTNGDILEDGP